MDPGICKISKTLFTCKIPAFPLVRISGCRLFAASCETGSEGLMEGLRAKVDLQRNGVGRKCAELFVNTICNSMKIRILAFEKRGRKYVKKFADGIAVSEKITTFASQ